MGILTKQVDRFVETEIDSEIVVMDLDSGTFFSLSDSALAIWSLIDGTRDRQAVLQVLAGEYGVAQEELAGDVDAFLAELGGAGLIAGV